MFTIIKFISKKYVPTAIYKLSNNINFIFSKSSEKNRKTSSRWNSPQEYLEKIKIIL